MLRSVSAHLRLEVTAPALVELQVAVAGSYAADEQLTITVDDRPVDVKELETPARGRLHRFEAEAGRLEVAYRAEVTGRVEPAPVELVDASTYLRPSRYAQSDTMAAIAAAELSDIALADLPRATAAWVGARLAYVSGSSRPTDGATDTLLAGQGVCRDFAHLTIALLRARDVPARLVAVYAPGLSPMDFHAVVEALVDGSWQVVDATALAPRQSLVRIATGRDAADTAFLSSYGGLLRLDEMAVTAVADELPTDDSHGTVSLT